MASPRLAISTLFLVKRKFDELVKTLGENSITRNWEIIDEGFQRLDSNRIKVLRDIGSTRDLRYSIHAPFSSINIAEPDLKLSGFFLSFLEDSLRRAYALEAENWIIHPGRLTPFTYFFPEKGFDALLKSLTRLIGISRDLGVNLVLENMMGPNDLFTDLRSGLEIAEKVEGIGFCIDSGHANIAKSLQDLMEGLPGIQYLHVHDNDGGFDAHLPVGEGEVDWGMMKDTLKRRGFDGWITAENYELQHAYKSISYFKNL